MRWIRNVSERWESVPRGATFLLLRRPIGVLKLWQRSVQRIWEGYSGRDWEVDRARRTSSRALSKRARSVFWKRKERSLAWNILSPVIQKRLHQICRHCTEKEACITGLHAGGIRIQSIGSSSEAWTS